LVDWLIVVDDEISSSFLFIDNEGNHAVISDWLERTRVGFLFGSE
jgi:hypothetical protein